VPGSRQSVGEARCEARPGAARRHGEIEGSLGRRLSRHGNSPRRPTAGIEADAGADRGKACAAASFGPAAMACAGLGPQISKTTPCTVALRSAWRSLADAIPRRQFDSSGKSLAIFHHSEIRETQTKVGTSVGAPESHDVSVRRRSSRTLSTAHGCDLADETGRLGEAQCRFGRQAGDARSRPPAIRRSRNPRRGERHIRQSGPSVPLSASMAVAAGGFSHQRAWRISAKHHPPFDLQGWRMRPSLSPGLCSARSCCRITSGASSSRCCNGGPS